MEVDGMYENTPWERLALWAPWLGLGVIVAAAILHRIAKSQGVDDPYEGFIVRLIANHLGMVGFALATLGTLFTVMWRPAHDTYPHAFGRAAIGVAAGAMLLPPLVGLLRRFWVTDAVCYSTLVAAAAAAAAIAAFSHSIIAEGQVTAMVLPVGYVVCAAFSAMIAAIAYRDTIKYEVLGTFVFFALTFIATQKLPVVQFRDDSSLYPVTGAFYIVAIGRVTRLFPPPISIVTGSTAIAIGYVIASWYGIAIAALGLSISGALDPRRLPSAESPPLHLTPG